MRPPSSCAAPQLRRLLATCLVTGGMAVTAVPTAQAAPDAATALAGPAAGAAEPGGLDDRDAELLARAQATGAAAVTLIIATDAGEVGDVAAAVGHLGGAVVRRFDRLRFVLASVPVGKVRAAAALPGVAAVDVDEVVALPRPKPENPAERPGRRPAAGPVGPGATTPAANPYLPTHETGAVAFKRRHPTYDGRGVTIGVMDSGIDLDNPALRTTSTGQRKVVDWVTATDPVLDGVLGGDGTWRAMVTPAEGPSFTAFGASWTAPAGSFRASVFVERITENSEYEGDVNRDGDNTDVFGVLYDPITHDIRVDVDQNRNFTDNLVLRPYRERFDIGRFGVDTPGTDVRDEVPFVVEYREDVDLTALGGGYVGVRADFVNIGIVQSFHGSHVAGIAAGNDLLGNPNLDGVAPGATLVSSRACMWGTGCSLSALTTGMADLVENRGVDVVNMSISVSARLNDGGSARSIIYNDLIDRRGVQIFLAAGNSGPGLNTVGDPAVASNAVAVASGISRATWLANYGSVVDIDYAVHNFSAAGPREDGGFKPDLTAPGAAISTAPMWQPGSSVPDTGYPLPPGYAMSQGTSMAAPLAAGAAALLLSAAKATGLTVTPAQLRRALYSAARWIDGVPAHAQGNGLVDVPGAWRLLRGPVAVRGYTAQAPVCTPLADLLNPPGRGVGIYNRCAPADGGHRPGQTKKYTITLTRTGGPARGIVHRLSWRGNDGTFRSAGLVVVPLNRAVNVVVTATPRAGVHSAILRIDDPATATVDFEVLSTVVAAAQPRPPAYPVVAAGSVRPNTFTSYFVAVPPGTSALQVDLSGIATGSQTRFIAFDPFGLPVEDTANRNCYTNYSDPQVCNPLQRLYRNPSPGVWEIAVEARRTTPTTRNPFRLTARLHCVGTLGAPPPCPLPAA